MNIEEGQGLGDSLDSIVNRMDLICILELKQYNQIEKLTLDYDLY